MKPDARDTASTKGKMTDVLTPEQRRLVMRRIKSKDSKPELLMRRGLHQRGLRYRLHAPEIPGKPDMVFPKHQTIILVHGCFWHGHDCSLFKWPKTRAEFWERKIKRNVERDHQTLAALHAQGWRVLVVWECALKGKHRRNLECVLDNAQAFIRKTGKTFAEIMEFDSISDREP